MIQIDFVNSEGRCLGDEIEDEDLSGGILDLWVMDHNCIADDEFSRLSKLINRSTDKLERVIVRDIAEVSPEFLVLLSSVCRKAHDVRFEECVLTDAVCGCLMSGMLHPDGIRGLFLDFPENALVTSAHQAELLFKGVAASSTLEKLRICLQFEEMEGSGKALAQALQQNQNLKLLQLHTPRLHSNTVLTDIFKAAAMNDKMEMLDIELTLLERRLPTSLLQHCLCRVNTSLNTLMMKNITLDVDTWDDTQENTSLTTLHLLDANLPCPEAMLMARSFKGLRNVNMNHNPFADLKPLGDLLLQSGSKLETVVVSMESQQDSGEKWTEFFQKVPNMHSIRHLSFPVRALANRVSKHTLYDALYVNSSLESIHLMDEKNEFEPDIFVAFCTRFSVPLSFNRAAKRMLQDQPSDQPLQPSLWPLVLERAMRLKYYSIRCEWETPRLRTRRADVVYWLLREKILI